MLADGRTEKIGKIVNQRMPVEVMSMDPETGKIEPRRIVEYYDNGETEEFLQFEVEAGGGSGKRKFACTPNHVIFTPKGRSTRSRSRRATRCWSPRSSTPSATTR